MTIHVIGAGNWGTTLAKLFASANEVVNAIHQQSNPVKELVTEAALTVAKNKLLEASKEGKLKEAFFALTPAVQEELREYANDLKKSA